MSSYRKIDQVAEWLLERGVPMTARQMIEAGFLFDDMSETTNMTVGGCLAGISNNPRYVIAKHYVNDGGRRMVAVQVKDIRPEAKRPDEPGKRELSMWRQLLTRKNGVCA